MEITRRNVLYVGAVVPFVGTLEACLTPNQVLALVEAIEGSAETILATIGSIDPALVPFVPAIEMYLDAAATFAEEVAAEVQSPDPAAVKAQKIIADAVTLALPSFPNAKAQLMVKAISDDVKAILALFGAVPAPGLTANAIQIKTFRKMIGRADKNKAVTLEAKAKTLRSQIVAIKK